MVARADWKEQTREPVMGEGRTRRWRGWAAALRTSLGRARLFPLRVRELGDGGELPRELGDGEGVANGNEEPGTRSGVCLTRRAAAADILQVEQPNELAESRAIARLSVCGTCTL